MKLAVYLGMAAFLCAGSLLWSGQVEHLDTKKRKMLRDLFLLAAGALFVLVATCRYGIGYDYFNYQTLYEQLGPMSVLQLLQDHVGQEFIGYSIFTRLMYLLGLSYRQLLLVVNLLLTAIVVWFVRRFSPLPWLGLYLYLTLQFFAHSMNLFRQSIAATICLLAYPFLKRRKLLPFALIVLLAATFHTSALFFLPFYWILNWRCDGRLFAAMGAVAVPVYLFSNQAAQFLTQYLFPNYAGYIGSRYWEGLGYRYAIFPILYFAAVWLLRKRLLQRDEGDRILINSAFYVMLLYIFCTHHMILERFSIYLFPYAMVLLPKLAASFLPAEGTSPTLPHKQRQGEKQQLEQQRYLAMLATVIVVLAGFGYLLFASQQGSNGFHKVYPYVSMWSQSQS